MGENTKIEWAHHTFNPWWGCWKISEGCKNCYAESMSNRFGDWWGPKAERRFFGNKHWNEPLKWNRKAEKEGVRHKVFVGSMCDIFEIHNEDVINLEMNLARHRLGELIKETPSLDWLFLTKRLENFLRLAMEFWFVKQVPANNEQGVELDIDIPDNVWIGTTVENQEMADKRIPELLKIPAKIRFLSCEPLLGPVDLTKLIKVEKYASGGGNSDIPLSIGYETNDIHWIIAGGESGPHARPMHYKWAWALRDQAKQANIPFMFKQWGEWLPDGEHGDREQTRYSGQCKVHRFPEDNFPTWRVGKKNAGHLLNGIEHMEFPGDKL